MMTKQITYRAMFTVGGVRRIGVPVKINSKTMWQRITSSSNGTLPSITLRW